MTRKSKPAHGLKIMTETTDGTGRKFYHCICGSFYDTDKRAFDYHVENDGKSPDADALSTPPNGYYDAAPFLEAARLFGKSTPVDNTVHNHGLKDVGERGGLEGPEEHIVFCICGVAFGSYDRDSAMHEFNKHIANPDTDEKLLEAHRARIEYSTRGDFEMLELFPAVGVGPEDCCQECGALVPYERERQIHLAWHNKLLP